MSRARQEYKAFISYKHSDDSRLAVQLEAALKRYAKPLLSRPTAIFRDETHLVPGSNLPKLIAAALEASEFLILLASPESARSPWVRDELVHWCKTLGRADNIIVVLVGGRIEVDPETKAIDWQQTDALPDVLRDTFDRVPLYVDLRELREQDAMTLVQPAFKRAVNSIVARLRNIDPNEMLGEEVLQHRRNLRLRAAALAGLAVLGVLGAGAGYLAFREGQRRQEALSREAQLLAAASLRAADEGRYLQSFELALRAFPNEAADEPRPYRVEAEAALQNAVHRSPLLYRGARPVGDLAAIFLSDHAGTALAVSYADEALVSSYDGSAPHRLQLSSITTYQQEVDCRAQVNRKLACRRSTMEIRPRPCADTWQVYPGNRRADVLEKCLAVPANQFAKSFLDADLELDDAALQPLEKQFEAAPMTNVNVTVRLNDAQLRRHLVPNFDARLLAAHSRDRAAIDVVSLGDGSVRAVLENAHDLAGMAWVAPDRLLAAFDGKIALFDVKADRSVSFEIDAFTIFTEGIPLAESEKAPTWIGITKTGQPIRFQPDSLTLTAEGPPGAPVSSAETLQMSSALTWTTGDSLERAVYVRSTNSKVATKVKSLFQQVVAVEALDGDRVAVFEREGALTIASSQTGSILAKSTPVKTNLRGAWLLGPRQFLLASEYGQAYVFDLDSANLRELDFAGAKVERSLAAPASVVLLAAAPAPSTGTTHIFQVPRDDDAPIFKVQAAAGGAFDSVGTDAGGWHLALSENAADLAVYSKQQHETTTYCVGLAEDDGSESSYHDFFHIERIAEERLLAVASWGLCFIDVADGAAREIPAEFHIEEFVYSRRWKLAIAGAGSWGLFALADGQTSYRPLEQSKGDISALALSHDERFLFALVDKTLLAWSLPDGALVFSAAPDWQPPRADVDGLAVGKLRALSLNRSLTLEVSGKQPLIAADRLTEEGHGDGVRLVRYDTGAARDFPEERAGAGFKFSPDGRDLAMLGENLQIIQGETGAIRYEAGRNAIESSQILEFDSSGKYLMAAPDPTYSNSAPVLVWSVGGVREPRALATQGSVERARFSRDGETILVSDNDGEVMLFQSATGQRLWAAEKHEADSELILFADDRLVGAQAWADLRMLDRKTGTTLATLTVDTGRSPGFNFRAEPVMVLAERNLILTAGTAAVEALPFHFDSRTLRTSAEERLRKPVLATPGRRQPIP